MNREATPPEDIEAWQKENAVEFLGQVDDMAGLLCCSHVASLPTNRVGMPKSLLSKLRLLGCRPECRAAAKS